MIVYIKKNLNTFNKEIKINFGFKVLFDESKIGFKNFDLDNENILIDSLINKINKDLKEPIYITLTYFFFENIKKLDVLSIEDDKYSSIITRNDL